MSFTPAHCRSARAWLNLTQQQLATSAGVGVSTVKDFENGSRTPIPNNLEALKRALEGAGGSDYLIAIAGLVPADTVSQDRAQVREIKGSASPGPKSRKSLPNKRPRKGGKA
jgi:transcriptional regulator with XRE-family HTH domain